MGPRYGSTRWLANRHPLTIDHDYGSTSPAWLDGWLATAQPLSPPAQPTSQPSPACQAQPAKPSLSSPVIFASGAQPSPY